MILVIFNSIRRVAKNGVCITFASPDKTIGEKMKAVLEVTLKIAIVLGLLYLFICSLDFLSNAFRLLGGTCNFTIALDKSIGKLGFNSS